MYHSFYIHWPFCPYKCHFCPFVAFAGQDGFMSQYHAALSHELMANYEACGKIDLKTIYFGGGTPSTYPDDLLLDMFGTLKRVSNFDEQTEITIEVNPGTITKEKLEHWRRLGVNRISMGVQSLNEQVLKNVNRLQLNADVYYVLECAKKLFDNMSIDLILGLPDISHEQWKEQLQKVVQWPIKHVAIYFLTVHEFTPLYYRVQKQDIVLPPDDALVDLYCWSVAFLQEHGFYQYEVSNFAQKGYESVHNRAYWQRKPYRGFGVGAWSFDGTQRFRNKKNLALYMKGVKEGDALGFSEKLNDEQVVLETIMLHLRQKAGLQLEEYHQFIASEDRESKLVIIADLKKLGLLEEHDGCLQLTVQGFAVEQEVIAALAP